MKSLYYIFKYSQTFNYLAVIYAFYISNQHGTGQSQNTDTVRYTTGGGISNISTDTKTVDPLLYEDPLGDFGVEVPVTTKPQVKKSAATATAPIYESPD